MNVAVITISILISVICVLLALLQHYYFISKLYKRPSIKYDVPIFEDLIPSDTNKFEHNYPLQTLKDHDDDLVLYDLNSVLESQPGKDDKVDFIINNDKATGTDSEVYNTLQAAVAFKLSGKHHKALKLFEHAAAIAPENADVLNRYGEFIEHHHHDIVSADELYFKV